MANPRIRQANSRIGVAQRLLDVCTIGGSLYVAQWLAGQDISDQSDLAAAATIIIYLLVCEFSAVYRTEHRRCANTDLLQVVVSWSVTVLCLALLSFFTRGGLHFARSSIFGWILLTGASLGLMRMLTLIATEFWFRSGFSVSRCAIAGLNPLGLQLQKNVDTNPACGLKILGFYDDRSKDRWISNASANGQDAYRGRLDELIKSAKAGQIDTVFVTLPMRAEKRIRWLLDELADTTVNAYIVPDFFVFELLHSRWKSIDGLPAVSVFESPVYGVDGWIKRSFDLAMACLILAAAAPIMLLCALLIKLTSPGPVFFRQKRYGLAGQEIWVWKFRSMKTCDNGATVHQATKGDDRITGIGKLLRRTSLDELPQLFNVIEGSMSLVGPRPHASAHNEHYRKLIRGYMLRHKVKPGITGLAQVEGFRGETETLDKMQKRVEFDHRYIQQWSVWLDLKILIRTVWVVAKQENAY